MVGDMVCCDENGLPVLKLVTGCKPFIVLRLGVEEWPREGNVLALNGFALPRELCCCDGLGTTSVELLNGLWFAEPVMDGNCKEGVDVGAGSVWNDCCG